MTQFRTGIGIDVHAFDSSNISLDNFIMVGGVSIPHDKKIKAHSDGDFLLHAITDAILGAIGEGNIGTYFPPSDKRWKDAPSNIFLEFSQKLCVEKGWIISNIDATIVAEAPKIMPYRIEIISNIARMMFLNNDQINVKATTSEGMGFIGKKDGVAAFALCTIYKD